MLPCTAPIWTAGQKPVPPHHGTSSPGQQIWWRNLPAVVPPGSAPFLRLPQSHVCYHLVICAQATASRWAGRGSALLREPILVMQVVAGGGGGVEATLSVYLKNLSETLGSKEQMAIAEFAEFLLITPKYLLSANCEDPDSCFTQISPTSKVHECSVQRKEHICKEGTPTRPALVTPHLETKSKPSHPSVEPTTITPAAATVLISCSRRRTVADHQE